MKEHENLSDEQIAKLVEERIELLKERNELDFKLGGGVTLEKGGYISDRLDDIEKELSQLKSPKPSSP